MNGIIGKIINNQRLLLVCEASQQPESEQMPQMSPDHDTVCLTGN